MKDKKSKLFFTRSVGLLIMITVGFLFIKSNRYSKLVGFFVLMSVSCSIIPLPTPPYVIGIRDLQNAAFSHSEERSDEESITTKLMELQYLSGLRFFAHRLGGSLKMTILCILQNSKLGWERFSPFLCSSGGFDWKLYCCISRISFYYLVVLENRITMQNRSKQVLSKN